MRYWWVSQNQTFQHEVSGGYLWSPKTKRGGQLNHYYETMREVSRADLIFSFCNKKIMAIGFARGAAYTCPKPLEFGSAGAIWNEIGWRIDAAFQLLPRSIQPRDHMKILGPLLEKQYSPIRPDGTGNQMYLTEISKEFGQVLIDLIGVDALSFLANRSLIVSEKDEPSEKEPDNYDLLKRWDKVQIESVEKDSKLTKTEKEQVIKSRRGQGKFRSRVSEIESYCRVTKVDRPEHLIASHIKPWSVSDNKERLDGQNGLFLTPSIDHLFGHGYISFRDNGLLLVSPTAQLISLIKMGIPRNEDFNCGTFTRIQAEFLEYHRDSIFLKARK